MAEIIACPACQRQLQVPETYYGQTVQCPECRHMFVANPHAAGVQAALPPPLPSSSPSAAAPPPADSSAASPPGTQSSTPSASSESAPDPDPTPRRQRYDEDDDDYHDTLPVRRSGVPHRGGMILALGIIALVIMPCSTIVCGPMAWVMGNTDLELMRNGMMSREGEGMTQAGRILGMVATGLMVLWLVLFCLYIIFIFALIGAHG